MKLFIAIILVINTYSGLASLTDLDKFIDEESKKFYQENNLLKKDNSVDEECVDQPGKERECYMAAFKGKCNTNREEMKKKCKRSCGYCCADMKGYKYCKSFLHAFCKAGRYKKSAHILCPDTCELCTRTFTAIPCATSEFGCCWDGSIAKNTLGAPDDGCPECKNLQSETFCENFKLDCDSKTLAGRQVYHLCPATCGYCGANPVCRDKPDISQDMCIRMRNEGRCEDNPKYMKFTCEKTCDMCPVCQDQPRVRCELLKTKYYACTNNKDRMAELCPRTCGFCSK